MIAEYLRQMDTLLSISSNAPHYPGLETFPYHLHDGAEDRVVSHPAITSLEVLQRILSEMEARGSIREE